MGCKYCEGFPVIRLFNNRDKLSKKREIYPGIEVEIDPLNSNMYIGACADTYEPGWTDAVIDINYCPMCGRHLRE